ncbi:T-complex-associated testis-expressed protein 1 [Lobulomyces angularis]|nr:T-complex-associated testis-expressed protein 1 [Lobulomyces angularis]
MSTVSISVPTKEPLQGKEASSPNNTVPATPVGKEPQTNVELEIKENESANTGNHEVTFGSNNEVNNNIVGGGFISSKERRMNQRKIIGEDPEWNLAPVKKLTALCIKVIVKNFEKNPIIDGIPLKYRKSVLSEISTSLPLSITANLIPDDLYWKKCAQEKFINCDPKRHGGSWKRLFFERYCKHLIEYYQPNSRVTEDINVLELKPLEINQKKSLQALQQQNHVIYTTSANSHQHQIEKNAIKSLIFTDTNRFLSELKLASPFVKTLELDQLRPKEPAEASVIKATDAPPDHLDLNVVFGNLLNIENISLYYGVRDCGINFNWLLFGMTITDCLNLSQSLKLKHVAKNLKYLKIESSSIDDDRCRLISNALLDNEALSSLDLSHNKICDSGARGLAAVLASPKTNLNSLILANNMISFRGAHAIGKALASLNTETKVQKLPINGLNTSNNEKKPEFGENSQLKVLNLRLNRLGDEGGEELLNLLLKNNFLTTLDLSGNNLGQKSIKSLCTLIRKNCPKLRRIDISCNKLGSRGGEKINQIINNLSGVVEKGNNTNSRVNSAGTQSSSGDSGQIEPDAAGKSLFEAISHNKYISTLDLRITEIPSEYVVAIQGIVVE